MLEPTPKRRGRRIGDAGTPTWEELRAFAIYWANKSGVSDFGTMTADELNEAFGYGGQILMERDGTVSVFKNAGAVARLAGS